MFSADMSYSVYTDNRKKDILILVGRPTQGLRGTTLTADKSAISVSE